jgi:cysteinyl-tRNA synthetase
MGKSLGNAYTLEDIAAKGYASLDLRYFFFMAQYSNFQNFTREALEQAKITRSNLQKKIAKALSALSPSFSPQNDQGAESFSVLADQFPQAEKLTDAVDEAMKDNLNTPKLLSVINNALTTPTAEVLHVLY